MLISYNRIATPQARGTANERRLIRFTIAGSTSTPMRFPLPLAYCQTHNLVIPAIAKLAVGLNELFGRRAPSPTRALRNYELSAMFGKHFPSPTCLRHNDATALIIAKLLTII